MTVIIFNKITAFQVLPNNTWVSNFHEANKTCIYALY